MLTYNDIYELLRKEKYSDVLQPLPKNFISEFSQFISENSQDYTQSILISDNALKSKKQLENAISIFRELMLKRKKKILNLIFIATETGIMKKDYENLLDTEKSAFDAMIKALEESDKELSRILSGKKDKIALNKMIIFRQEVSQFIDHTGGFLGPYKQGELVNMDSQAASLFVEEGKATFIENN